MNELIDTRDALYTMQRIITDNNFPVYNRFERAWLGHEHYVADEIYDAGGIIYLGAGIEIKP